tara:strand:- start:503 stop:685 length:183 start_codon:yes stop_codon:yes gene_type:complete
MNIGGIQMGFSNISPWSLLIILMIVVILFGTKHLKTASKDLLDTFLIFQKKLSKQNKRKK